MNFLKKLRISQLFLALVVAGTVVLSSCEKESDKIQPDMKIENEMLVFKNEQAFNKESSKRYAMSLDELMAYEDEKGLKSFGRICEEVYANIDEDEFQTEESTRAMLDREKDYMQLVYDENGEPVIETVCFENNERYVLNEDAMVQVEDKVIKYFNGGSLVASLSELEELKSIKQAGFDKGAFNPSIEKKQIVATQKSAQYNYNCGMQMHDSKESGKERILMHVNAFNEAAYNLSHNATETRARVEYKIWSQKKLWGWKNVQRTMSCDLKMKVYYEVNGYGTEVPLNYKKSGDHTYSIKNNKYWYKWLSYGGTVIGTSVYFSAGDCEAWNVSVSEHPSYECNLGHLNN